MAAALPRSERRAGGYVGPRGTGLCCGIGVRGTCVAGEDKPPPLQKVREQVRQSKGRKGTTSVPANRTTDVLKNVAFFEKCSIF